MGNRNHHQPASMNRQTLVASLLWLTAGALPAQYFMSVGAETRRTAHALWLGLSGQQRVAIEYGAAQWRPDYERALGNGADDPYLLGNGGLMTLHTDVDLTFGALTVKRGRWYVGARCRHGRDWALALFAADRVDAGAHGATTILSTEPDLRVPVRVVREDARDQVVQSFEVALTAAKQSPPGLTLTMAWGPFRLDVDLAPAFDARKPEGTPDFAMTAAGKGTKTQSGLTYEPLTAGAGDKPRPTDLVRVHYTGWLADGTMFDSTHVRGEPATLASQWVVSGFAEGLLLMQPGGTARFTIPPELAFGARGMGDRVPPNSTLVYTVTLLGIKQQ
jgi:FKBP-type peptidyl-prolyl cis-trans isomerase FkpA